MREKLRRERGASREWAMTLSMTSQGRRGDCMIVEYKRPRYRSKLK